MRLTAKEKAYAHAVDFLVKNPTASAYKVAQETGVTQYTARKLIRERQTPVDALLNAAQKLIAEHKSDGWRAVENAQVEEALTDSRGAAMLKEAAETFKQRGKQYGSCRDTLFDIAQIWTGILGEPITCEQVALMMIGLKMARLRRNPKHKDSMIDIAGWAAVYAEGVQ
jgi:hypothetical protein